MAILAIRGHATRGKEVIEILEMFGGKNKSQLNGSGPLISYYIDNDEIVYARTFYIEDSIGFLNLSLEEFLEKFPYKVGDKVKIIDYEHSLEVVGLRWNNDAVEYEVYTNDYGYWFKVEELQPYKEQEPIEEQKLIPPYMGYDVRTSKEEPMEENEILNQLIDYFNNTPRDVIEKEWRDYDKYNEVGPTIKEYMEFVNSNRKPQYPKTYDECEGEVLDYKLVGGTVIGYNAKLITSFQRLLICRDAYWKLAGEQMGLGKPWKPDFTNNDEERYGIYTLANKVEKDFCAVGDVNTILVFPTEEMRDAFYENFKELIEQCKELL